MINVKLQKVDKFYIIGIMLVLKISFKDKFLGGFKLVWESFFRILNELKKFIVYFSINKLGGLVVFYQVSS